MEPLLRGVRGGRLGRQQAWRVVSRLGEAAGLDSPLTPHLLRHTHITRALAAGVGLVGVQASAGYRDVRTTLAYNRALLWVREAVAGLIGRPRQQWRMNERFGASVLVRVGRVKGLSLPGGNSPSTLSGGIGSPADKYSPQCAE